MANYVTDYPVVVILENNEIATITVDDNRERTLITETESDVDTLTKIFRDEGFNQTSIEEKKKLQLCDGFRKKISQEWDMHVRFLGIHSERIAIDAEVETSTEYLQHVTKPQHWISVIYEVQNILSKHGINFKIWHKKTGSYIRQIVQKTSLTLLEADGKIKWKPIALGIAILIAATLIIQVLSKK